MMSDFLNLISLFLTSLASDLSSICFNTAYDFASVLWKISSWRSSICFSAICESTSDTISFAKSSALANFSYSTLSSVEVFCNGGINSGYFVIRWVTNRMHSGIPFFFRSGFWRQCLYHSAKFWSSVWIHLNVASAERWFEANSPEKLKRKNLIFGSLINLHERLCMLNGTVCGNGNQKTENVLTRRFPVIQWTYRMHFSAFELTTLKRTRLKYRQCCRRRGFHAALAAISWGTWEEDIKWETNLATRLSISLPDVQLSHFLKSREHSLQLQAVEMTMQAINKEFLHD